ncbi:hypothetical protein VOLCADRAFT_118041, partial [Volvox carteri f. nagariensis]
VTDWRATVIRCHILNDLQYGMWERIQEHEFDVDEEEVFRQQERPCPRESHAAAPWGRGDSMIVFGGLGERSYNDLFILDRVYDDDEGHNHDAVGPAGPSSGPSRPAAAVQSTTAAAATARGAASMANEATSGNSTGLSQHPQHQKQAGSRRRTEPWLGPGEEPGPYRWQWRIPRVAGRAPAARRGHTATRCGRHGELLAVYGGSLSLGMDPNDTLVILGPYTATTAAGSDDDDHGLEAQDEYEYEYEYEWYRPTLQGPNPGSRCYHGACASEDGLRLFLFGGISERNSIAQLTVIDLASWTVEYPVTTGSPPSPRFGCSMVVYGNRLWVIGGGNGGHRVESGVDLDDIFTLDLTSMKWTQLTTVNRPHDEKVLGRCHSSTLVGSKLVLFGGSLELGNDIAWLDLDRGVWGRPVVQGQRPGMRMCASLVRCGSDLLVYGGWRYSCGEMGDLHRLRLLVTGHELKEACGSTNVAAMQYDNGAFDPSGPIPSPSLLATFPPWDAIDILYEFMSARIAELYLMMREALEWESTGVRVPVALSEDIEYSLNECKELRSLCRWLNGDEDVPWHDMPWIDDEDDAPDWHFQVNNEGDEEEHHVVEDEGEKEYHEEEGEEDAGGEEDEEEEDEEEEDEEEEDEEEEDEEEDNWDDDAMEGQGG